MRKVYLFAALVLLAMSANADNWFRFTDAVNDTLRIKPSRLGGYSTYEVEMSIDAYADFFRIGITWPCGLRPKMLYGVRGIEAGCGMSVCYLDRNGAFASYDANLNVGEYYESVTGYIPVDGYWDYNHDGVYESYGTAKWEPGVHPDMLRINLWVEECYRKGHVVFDCQFNSGSDRRGPILSNVYSWQQTLVYVGYMRGDCTGNEKINIDDVSTLIAYLLGNAEFDEFEAEAADVDGNGYIGINDVAALINKLMK
jgi:hypothetical protein